MTAPDQIPDYDPRDDFDRTRCDCDSCLAACRHIPGGLIPQDMNRITESLSVDDVEAWSLQHLLASAGAEVPLEGELCQLPTIVPDSRPDGSCVFLDNDRCTIHEVAPYGCSHLDMHLSSRESRLRSNAGLRSIAIDWAKKGPYSRLWGALWESGNVARSLEERRAKLDAALAETEQNVD